MTQPDWLIKEVQRRAYLLRNEVKRRYTSAINDPEAEGLHYSQILALNTMMQTFFARQETLLGQLHAAQQFDDAIYRQLLAEITGGQGLWRVFHYILDQRTDARAKNLLDTADLIAHSCYRPCIEQARGWGLFKQEFREPPLTYLDAVHSPLAAARTSRVQALGMYVGRYRDQQLPVPITVLPVDHMTSLWLFTALAHEVGHHLDQDLHPPNEAILSTELRAKVLTALAKSTPLRRNIWARWCPEILADAFGILLGGAGFIYTMGSFLLPLAGTTSPSIDATTNSDHPPSLVRLNLLMQMAHQLAKPALKEAVDWMALCCTGLPQPSDVGAAQKESAIIAHTIFDTPFAALGGRCLIELVPELDADLQATAELASALLDPATTLPSAIEFPYRLVPSAAQIALAQLPNPDEHALEELHKYALAFFRQIPLPPQALAAEVTPSDEYIRQLSAQIQFSFDEP